MKKPLLIFAAIACCAILSVFLTSCDKENNPGGGGGNGGGGNAVDNKSTAVEMTYNVAVHDDFFKYLVSYVEYYDGNGKVQKEKMTSKKWTKTVKANLPVTLGFRMYFNEKTGVNPVDSKIDARWESGYSAEFLNAQGAKTIDYSGDSKLEGYDVPSKNFDAWFDRDKGKYMCSMLLKIDANANLTKEAWNN